MQEQLNDLLKKRERLYSQGRNDEKINDQIRELQNKLRIEK